MSTSVSITSESPINSLNGRLDKSTFFTQSRLKVQRNNMSSSSNSSVMTPIDEVPPLLILSLCCSPGSLDD